MITYFGIYQVHIFEYLISLEQVDSHSPAVQVLKVLSMDQTSFQHKYFLQSPIYFPKLISLFFSHPYNGAYRENN